MTTFEGFIRPTRVIVSCLLLGCWSTSAQQAKPADAARIRQIAAMLPATPTGMAQPITNRTAWNSLAVSRPELKGLVEQAAKLATEPLAEQPDTLYLEFSQNGDRARWQAAEFPRRRRVQVFAMAECFENQGRFIVPLERTIAALCAEKTWVWSAHDGHLQNFRGETIEIDLGAAELGADVAAADCLLGDRLSPGTRKLIRENLERRIFGPYRSAINGARPEFYWMHGGNNWNAVCLSGVTGAALAVIGPAEDRAWFVANAEKRIDFYLKGGFTSDGYCVEGLGYWNYGFGNFLLLAENIRQATRGGIDLLAEKPLAAQPALYGFRSEICNGVYTSIADCDPGDVPSSVWMNYLCRRLGMDSSRWREAGHHRALFEETALAFLPESLPTLHLSNDLQELPWRSWLPDGGVLVCRPGTGVSIPFAAAIKGGNNGFNHAHNDLGSFSVVAGKTMLLCDPGAEVYTARTFSPHRYDSKVLSSFGHDVPVVAGQLQSAGAQARAVVVARNFTPAADTLTLDIRPAYEAANLEKLERTFVFRRGQQPSLEVRDEIKYAAPEHYETALITWGEFRRVSDNELEFVDGKDAVRVVIDTQGRAFSLKQETIDENVRTKTKPVRLGIALNERISTATITMRISPLTH